MTRHLSHNESLHIAGSFIDAGQLKAFNTAALPNSAWAYVDGIGEYYFDLNSSATESIPDIIAPDAGAPGRWKKKALSAISDFNIIKQTAASSGKLSLSGGTLTGPLTLHADPANALHAVTKQYVDNLITGISWKDACKAATTANISLSGIQTIDDISLTDGDRVLVKNQSVQTQNGIYVVGSGTWNRSEDVNSNSELETATVLVEEGTANKNTQWTCTSVNVTIGTSNITFGQISGAGTYTAGAGLQLTGSEFKLDATYFADGSRAGLLSSSDWSRLNSSFVNGGNAFGSNAILGTNDNTSLELKTNSTSRIIINPAGDVSITNTTLSSSSTTGALVISGGLGIGGTTNIAGVLNVNNAATVPANFSGTNSALPVFILIKNGAGSNVANYAGTRFQTKNSNGTDTTGADVLGRLSTSTAGSEVGEFSIRTLKGGSVSERFSINGDVTTITSGGLIPLTVTGAQSGGTVRNTFQNSSASSVGNLVAFFLQTKNDSGNYVNAGQITANLSAITTGAESSTLSFQTYSAGTLANRIVITGNTVEIIRNSDAATFIGNGVVGAGISGRFSLWHSALGASSNNDFGWRQLSTGQTWVNAKLGQKLSFGINSTELINLSSSADGYGTLQFTSSYAVTTGSTAYHLMNLTPVYNQTGTATGIVRGIYYNPTITSVLGTHYAWESTAGDILVTGGKVAWSGASVSNSAAITGVHNLGGSAILTGTTAGATATVYNFTPGVTTNDATHQARAVVINPTFTNNVTPEWTKGNLSLYVAGQSAFQTGVSIGTTVTSYGGVSTQVPYLLINGQTSTNIPSVYISNNFSNNIAGNAGAFIYVNNSGATASKPNGIYVTTSHALANGIGVQSQINGSYGGQAFYGNVQVVGNSSTSFGAGGLYSYYAQNYFQSNGTIMTVPLSYGYNSTGVFAVGSVVVTNHYDYAVNNFSGLASGGFTNRYGLYLNHTKGAGDTNVWGVYQTSNTVGNVFKGDTFIGDQTFSTLAGRHVYLAGTVRIRPAADGENKIELNGTGEYISSGSYLALSYGSNEFLRGTSTTVRLTPGNGAVTSGTKNAVEISNTWSQNAGTAVYNALSVNPAIVQTDAANGAVRGIYYNPSITSIIGTHYAWESTAGDILVTSGKVTWSGASVSNSATITGVHNLGGSAILTGATANATAAVYNFTPNVTTNDATHQARAVVINPAFTNNVTPNYSRGNLALYVNGRVAIQTGLSIGTTNTNYNSASRTAKLLISTTNTLEDPGIFISDDLDVNSGRALYSGRSFSNSTGTTAIFQASLINNSASTYGPITGTGFTYRGFSSGTNGAGGYYAQVGVTGTSSTVLSNSYMGFYSYGYYQSTSGVMTVPISTGFASGGQFQTSGGGTNVITNHYDFYTENFSNLPAGGFTNRYGLYLNHTKNAGDTNIWGVYQVSNTVNNFFAGPTTFGNSGTETKITMNGGSSGGGTASFMIGTGGLFTNNYFGFTYNGAAIYEIPSSSRFRFYNNVVLAGGGTSPFTIFGGGGGSTTTAGTAIRLGHGGIANGILTYTSGTFSLLGIGGNNSSLTDQAFAPSSGNGSYNVILVDPIFNQTGTANGTVRGIHYNPTVTSVLGSHYAFEAAAGDIYLRAGGLRLMDSGYDRLAVSVQSAGILNIGGGGWNQVLIPTPFLTFTNANAVIQSSNSGNPLSILTPGGAGSAHNGVIIGRTGGGINATSGTGNALTIGSATQDIFQPTSGTAVYNAINIAGRLNQTDTANGTVRGIYYNPAITSVLGTHYAFESTSGDMLLGGTGKFMMNKSGTPSSAMEVSSSSLKVGSGFATTEVNNPVFKSVSQNISGSVTIDLSQGRVFYLTITGNVTSFSFTNEVQNAQYMFYFIKGTTNYTMAWAAGKFRFPFASPIILTDPTVNGTTPAGSVDVLSAFCAVSGRLDIVLSPDLQNN